MRLNLHDFSGHPFQVQLSRALASLGHEVLHGYSSQFVTGHGRLETTADDAPTLRIESITAPVPMIKYSPLGRTRFELQYATAWQRALAAEPPFEAVVACNVPLFTLARMRRYFAARRQPWVLWHQDLYSLGVGAEAARRLPPGLARGARRWVEAVERRQVNAADAVVAITEAMVARYRAWGIGRGDVHVIPNWAPLDEVLPTDRANAWAKRHELPEDAVRLMYAGTLGRKHNPLLLLELLDAARARGVDAHLVVVSEGAGADDLRAAAAGRHDVRILGYQPAEDMSEMLGAADAVIALLEPDAAQFSVPSKVLTYLAAGRPVIALMPAGNQAAGDVAAVGGYVGPPSPAGAHGAADWLAAALQDPEGLDRIGAAARSLAVARFDIDRTAARFEHILETVSRSRDTGARVAVIADSPRLAPS